MSKQTIWNYFKRHTQLSDEAIAGIMGNFEAESNNESCRVQGDFTADRRTSREYAQKVNSGAISPQQWQSDARGFGLAQWTYFSRKANLLSTAQSYGTGIEDETTQIRFFLAEMQTEFVSTWRALLNDPTILEAARLVCVNYERPAVNNVAARADCGQTIYNQFHGKDVEPEPDPDPAPEPKDDLLREWIEYEQAEADRHLAKAAELKARLKT